jgi:hypothetical protein
MVLGLMVILLVVSSCAKPEKKILGKWVSSVSSLNVLTFREDGTFEYSIPGEKVSGTYRVEGTQLELNYPGMVPNPGVMEFELSDGRLILKGSGDWGTYFGGVWVKPQ